MLSHRPGYSPFSFIPHVTAARFSWRMQLENNSCHHGIVMALYLTRFNKQAAATGLLIKSETLILKEVSLEHLHAAQLTLAVQPAVFQTFQHMLNKQICNSSKSLPHMCKHLPICESVQYHHDMKGRAELINF